VADHTHKKKDLTMSAISIFSEHLQDLRNSGLTDETIRMAGIFSIHGHELTRYFGKSYLSVKSAMVFPYGGGFYRAKLFPAIHTKDGKIIRYLQRKGSAPRIYIPKGVEKYLLDPNVTLGITEGEKKALAAFQNGLPCIAVAGVWSWLSQGRPISDFDLIAWKHRRILIIGDADVWLPKNDNLRRAVFALAKEIESRGAKSDLIILPGEVEL